MTRTSTVSSNTSENKDRREEFFREYKEIEMLYEIISPDVFIRPFMDDYATLSAIYAVVQNAYTKKVYVDRAFQKKTNELVQKSVGMGRVGKVTEFVKIDSSTIELIKQLHSGDGTRIINLVKSIEQAAQDESNAPFLIALADRAKEPDGRPVCDAMTSTRAVRDRGVCGIQPGSITSACYEDPRAIGTQTER